MNFGQRLQNLSGNRQGRPVDVVGCNDDNDTI
jgi:hypothetical protein